MKFSKFIIFAILATVQLTAQAESKHEHEHHEKHSEKSHDEHKHEEAGHEKHDDHDDHKHEKDGHDDHEEHGSHEHGVAQMTIAVGGNGLDIQLETPAANILGFEHEASSDEDKKTLKEQKAKLLMIDKLFAVNGEAKCTPANTKVSSPLFKEHDDHADEKHEHEKHDHEKHDHEEYVEKGAHNDIDVNWTFNCKDSKVIDHVDVKLFSMFPKGFEKIKVDWVSDSSASTVSLTEDGMVKFK